MKIAGMVKKNKLLFVVILIYMILFIVVPSKGIEAVKNSMYYVIEMLEIIPVIFILTSLLEAWVPKEIIINSFGEKSGIRGNFLSFILGSFSAGPIYAAFPVCKMLIKKGASITNIVIILSAWAVVKVPMLANEAKFLGVKFMLIRWIFTTLAIFFMAYLVALFVKKDEIPRNEVGEGQKGISINEEYCIGCGLCSKLYPNYFKMIGNKAVSTYNNDGLAEDEQIRDVVNRCPAKAISFRI